MARCSECTGPSDFVMPSFVAVVVKSPKPRKSASADSTVISKYYEKHTLTVTEQGYVGVNLPTDKGNVAPSNQARQANDGWLLQLVWLRTPHDCFRHSLVRRPVQFAFLDIQRAVMDDDRGTPFKEEYCLSWVCPT